MTNENLWKPLWSDLSARIDRELPGEPLWSQAIPLDSGDVAEGLAIRRESDWYLLIYFRLLPTAVSPSGALAGGRSAEDWDVEVGYRGDFDTLEEAKAESQRILADLPTPESLQKRPYGFFLDLLKPEELAEDA